MYNIETFYRSRNNVIKLFDDYSSIVSEVKYEITCGKGLKVLTPEQMLQRLPIALAKVKAGKIINCLYQAKEITKKIYNNIMNSIKL